MDITDLAELRRRFPRLTSLYDEEDEDDLPDFLEDALDAYHDADNDPEQP